MQKQVCFLGLLIWCVCLFLLIAGVEAVLPPEYAAKRKVTLLKEAQHQRQEASEVLFIHVISSKTRTIDDDYCPAMEERKLRVRVVDVKKTGTDIKTGDIVAIIYRVCVAKIVGPQQFFPPQLKPGDECPAFLSCKNTMYYTLAANAWSFTPDNDFNARLREAQEAL